MRKKQTIGIRLAIRREGKFINAYLAQEGTMDGAMVIGSLLTAAAEKDKRTFDLFKQCMSSAIAAAVEDIFGEEPDMIERTAPEHERSGEA